MSFFFPLQFTIENNNGLFNLLLPDKKLLLETSDEIYDNNGKLTSVTVWLPIQDPPEIVKIQPYWYRIKNIWYHCFHHNGVNYINGAKQSTTWPYSGQFNGSDQTLNSPAYKFKDITSGTIKYTVKFSRWFHIKLKVRSLIRIIKLIFLPQ